MGHDVHEGGLLCLLAHIVKSYSLLQPVVYRLLGVGPM
jgi:hypothetical protein